MGAWLYVDPPPDPGSVFGIRASNPFGGVTYPWPAQPYWFQVSYMAATNLFSTIAVVGTFDADWSGIVYVDDIQM